VFLDGFPTRRDPGRRRYCRFNACILPTDVIYYSGKRSRNLAGFRFVLIPYRALPGYLHQVARHTSDIVLPLPCIDQYMHDYMVTLDADYPAKYTIAKHIWYRRTAQGSRIRRWFRRLRRIHPNGTPRTDRGVPGSRTGHEPPPSPILFPNWA
jgi:hypothetical protein